MPFTSRNQAVAAPSFAEYCYIHCYCTTCQQCPQVARHIYLLCTVSTNYRQPDPCAWVNAVVTLCFRIRNVYVYTQTPYIDMVLVYTYTYAHVYAYSPTYP